MKSMKKLVIILTIMVSGCVPAGMLGKSKDYNPSRKEMMDSADYQLPVIRVKPKLDTLS